MSNKTAEEILIAIADAYDANNLDDEARKYIYPDGKTRVQTNNGDPNEIVLYSGRGGKELLTLGDCLRIRKEKSKQ